MSKHVDVPVIVEDDGAARPLGAYTEPARAEESLRQYLKHRNSKRVERASISRWELDNDAADSGHLVANLSREICPLCGRYEFWWDLVQEHATCLGTSCGAWFGKSKHQVDVLEVGWVAGKKRKSAKSVNGAIATLRSWRPPELGEIALVNAEEILRRRAELHDQLRPDEPEESISGMDQSDMLGDDNWLGHEKAAPKPLSTTGLSPPNPIPIPLPNQMGNGDQTT